MTGFEPGSSGIGRDRSANCATTTADRFVFVIEKSSPYPHCFTERF